MPTEQEFLTNIQSDNADTRFAAWRAAGDAPDSVIPKLGALAGGDNRGVAKAAREALTTMTHSVGKDSGNPKRPAVVKGLLGLTSPDYAIPVRVLAFRLLSNIAGEEHVADIAKTISDPELREEVVFCLERIPGKASLDALLSAYASADSEFKPRILAAFGHRRAAEAVELCVEEMQSADIVVALAAMKAFGRIGKAPAGNITYPDESRLSDFQKTEFVDSLLRYADAQAASGNASRALAMYKDILGRPEEHWQCAAVIGAAKIATPESAALLLPVLESTNSTVRITAQKAWKSIATPQGDGSDSPG